MLPSGFKQLRSNESNKDGELKKFATQLRLLQEKKNQMNILLSKQ